MTAEVGNLTWQVSYRKPLYMGCHTDGGFSDLIGFNDD